jgi:hypothetical protein
MPVSCQLMTTDLRSGATITATKPLLYPVCAPCTRTSASAQEIKRLLTPRHQVAVPGRFVQNRPGDRDGRQPTSGELNAAPTPASRSSRWAPAPARGNAVARRFMSDRRRASRAHRPRVCSITADGAGTFLAELSQATNVGHVAAAPCREITSRARTAVHARRAPPCRRPTCRRHTQAQTTGHRPRASGNRRCEHGQAANASAGRGERRAALPRVDLTGAHAPFLFPSSLRGSPSSLRAQSPLSQQTRRQVSGVIFAGSITRSGRKITRQAQKWVTDLSISTNINHNNSVSCKKDLRSHRNFPAATNIHF